MAEFLAITFGGTVLFFAGMYSGYRVGFDKGTIYGLKSTIKSIEQDAKNHIKKEQAK